MLAAFSTPSVGLDTRGRFYEVSDARPGTRVMTVMAFRCIRRLAGALTVGFLVLAWPASLQAQDNNPLHAVNTASPQATLRSFLTLTEALEEAFFAYLTNPNAATQATTQRLRDKLIRLFDMSQVPPALRQDVGGDAMAFLVDVIRRLDVPPLETIPDAKAFPDANQPASWAIPDTEISITRMMEGTRKGEFLFSADTVSRAGEFHALVKNLPLKRPDRVESWRDLQLQSHGWMIPPNLVIGLPSGLKQQVLDTPAWKVLGTALIILLAGTIVWLWHRLTRPRALDHRPVSYLRRLLTPIALVAAILGVGYVIEDQINVIGDFADVVEFAITIALYIAAAWALWLATLLVIEWIIASPAIPDEGLDANLLRLLGRVVGIFAIAMVAAHGGQQLGIPVLGVLAGLGVGGLAVALAAQSSVENLIGGLNLYADRPIRVGDLCAYGSIKGHVEHIGLRSTRIRGLDRTVTTVPNSELAKVQITNFAFRDQMLFHHVLDLPYETTIEQLRFLALSIRNFLMSHPRVRKEVALPRVHVVGFGEWSIKVEVHAYIDAKELPEFLATQEEFMLWIMALVNKADLSFAFPSQTSYIARDVTSSPTGLRRAIP
jgi:MscS family membrane protein